MQNKKHDDPLFSFFNKPYSSIKKRYLYTFLILCWLILGSFFGTILKDTVNASVSGDYYVCDFTGIVDNTYNLSQYDNGVNWLNIETINRPPALFVSGNRVEDNLFAITQAVSGNSYSVSWFNFTVGTTEILFPFHTVAYAESPANYVIRLINTSSNLPMFRFEERRSGTTIWIKILYGNNGTVIYQTTSEWNLSDVNFQFFNSNNT
jgi:hypothetical protein